MRTEQKKIVPIVVFSDGETWESIPDFDDPGPNGAMIRFVSAEQYHDLCIDLIDASDCTPQKPDIPLHGFMPDSNANAAQECLIESELEQEFEDSVYIRIPRHLWENWSNRF